MSPLIRDLIIDRIQAALEKFKTQGSLPLETLPKIFLEHPADPSHGDYATSLPLRLAKSTRIAPMNLAKSIADQLDTDHIIKEIYTASPGFINFRLSEKWIALQVDTILDEQNTYGNVTGSVVKKVMVEYVSVNPTGPVHVGHIRGAVIGSVLASLLEAVGHVVTREYYVNDAGTQMDLFYESVYARYLEAAGRTKEFPSGGYKGEYVTQLGEQILRQEGLKFSSCDRETAIKQIGALSRNKMVDMIRKDLEALGVHFDVWFTEKTLYESGEYQQTMDKLNNNGYLAERDGARWFTSTSLGEDKDNVVVRSTGAPTYFASDIAYHHNKFISRGFDQVINVWGADHQGHISRLKAAMLGLGVDPSRLNILVSQMVTLKRGGQLVKASKRSGNFISLRELVDEVGVDACRYFFLTRSANSQMDFDMSLAKRQSSENPIYYIQYAHARISGILRNANDQAISWRDGDVSLLTRTTELTLIREMLKFPELIIKAADNLEPHHLPYYASQLATAFHHFYEKCRVLSSDPKDQNITLARLKLVEASKIVLGRSLTLMGVGTPENM